jgi:hypothetical protein
MSISDFLAESAGTSKKTPTRGNPEVDIHHDGVEATCSACGKTSVQHGHYQCDHCGCSLSLVDRCYQAYRNQQDVEAQFKSLEGQLLSIFKEEYREAAENGDFSKTFNFVGRDTPGVQFSAKDQFINIPLEKEAALRNILGVNFDKYFAQKRTIALADTSDSAIEFLLAKLGKDDFKRLFSIGMAVTTKPDLDMKQFSLPKEARMALVQHKPSMKIRSEK